MLPFPQPNPETLGFIGSVREGPRSCLADVLAFALVRVELLLDSGLCFRLPTQRMMRWKLHIAKFADSQHWNVICAPHDSEFSLCHTASLRRSFRRSRAVDFKLYRYPYPPQQSSRVTATGEQPPAPRQLTPLPVLHCAQ